jgi:hypothetical protein
VAQDVIAETAFDFYELVWGDDDFGTEKEFADEFVSHAEKNNKTVEKNIINKYGIT